MTIEKAARPQKMRCNPASNQKVLSAWQFIFPSQRDCIRGQTSAPRDITPVQSARKSRALRPFLKDYIANMKSSQEKVILLVGCCGLDRLMTVSSYPRADAKVQTTAYHEMGGGNAANTACAMALLCDASLFKNENFRIKLLSKVGDDYIGQQLKDELQKSGVDVSLLCFGGQGTTTGFTSVIVSEAEDTRTCIHTPGTCGELTLADIASENLEELFANVVHVHFDSRNANLSLVLAQEAHRRNIPISVDAEKDRHTKSLDQLLEIADMVFTNSSQLNGYLDRWTGELEAEHKRQPLAVPVISTIGGNPSLLEICAKGIFPCHFFQRWYGAKTNKRKELIITKGHMGALHVYCDSSSTVTEEGSDGYHEVIATDSEHPKIVEVNQNVLEVNATATWRASYSYQVHYAGVIKDAHVIDTTGAGDAFIGGYILTHLRSSTPDDPIQFGLEFGAWVGGKKLSGPGARSALPKGCEVDDQLGRTTEEVQGRLGKLLRPFAPILIDI